MKEDRKVKRVLVMLEYANAADPANGEVFDLTALALEMASGKSSRHTHAQIALKITATEDYTDYDPPNKRLKAYVEWNVMADFHSSGDAGHLEDAINASLPDSFATQDLRKRLSKLRKKTEQLEGDIQAQRLRDAAAVRHQFPIARVTQMPLLAEVAESSQAVLPN